MRYVRGSLRILPALRLRDGKAHDPSLAESVPGHIAGRSRDFSRACLLPDRRLVQNPLDRHPDNQCRGFYNWYRNVSDVLWVA